MEIPFFSYSHANRVLKAAVVASIFGVTANASAQAYVQGPPGASVTISQAATHGDFNVVITNSGDVAANFTPSPAFVISGTNADRFSIVPPEPTSVPPMTMAPPPFNFPMAGSATIVVRYTPGAETSAEASLLVKTDAQNGNLTIPISGNVQVDTDLDGVYDSTENNIGYAVDGDANYDGTSDSLQAHVVPISSGYPVPYCISGPEGSRLSNVERAQHSSAFSAPSIPDPSPGQHVDCTNGYFRFTVNQLSTGQAIVVKIIVPESSFAPSYQVVNSFWKYGARPGNPTPAWYQFTHDGTTGATVGPRVNNRKEITLNLVDGQRGDGDVTANGVIQDPGAPANTPGSAVSDWSQY